MMHLYEPIKIYYSQASKRGTTRVELG